MPGRGSGNRTLLSAHVGPLRYIHHRLTPSWGCVEVPDLRKRGWRHAEGAVAGKPTRRSYSAEENIAGEVAAGDDEFETLSPSGE
jgi:hypothetical protein